MTFTIENGAVVTTDNDLTAGVTYTPKANSEPDTYTVPNTPGAVLPATGGPGTGIFYGAGASLMLLAVLGIVLQSRRRERGEGI